MNDRDYFRFSDCRENDHTTHLSSRPSIPHHVLLQGSREACSRNLIDAQGRPCREDDLCFLASPLSPARSEAPVACINTTKMTNHHFRTVLRLSSVSLPTICRPNVLSTGRRCCSHLLVGTTTTRPLVQNAENVHTWMKCTITTTNTVLLTTGTCSARCHPWLAYSLTHRATLVRRRVT